MTGSIALLTGAAVLAASLAGSVFMQGMAYTPAPIEAGPASVATGYRVFKVVDNPVANETAGTLAAPNDTVPLASPPVGGFLGVGSKYVAMPYRSFEAIDKRPMLPGATRDPPKRLPDFKHID